MPRQPRPLAADPQLLRTQQRKADLQLKLTEAAFDFYAQLGITDPRDLQQDLDGFSAYPTLIPPYYRQSQKRGEVLPVYTTELELRLFRDRSRRLVAENEFAICAVENRRSYVAGKGLTIRAAAARPDCPPELIHQTQTVIDYFAEANQLDEVASDMVLRWDRDGEDFRRFFEQPNGLLLMRPVEAEHVKGPLGDAYGPAYSFGVQTEPDDIAAVRGYWVVERPILNPMPTFVPAADVLHTRLNVDLSAKRGLPTFYPVEGNLRRAEDLLASMTSMAKTRAKIALIRKFNGVLSSTAQTMAAGLTDLTATDPGTGAAVNFERLRYGSILNASGNIDYEFPSGDVAASDYVAILQAELRAVAARLCMPEWMLTVDASNANYSSSLIAEAPSTKMFERLQHKLAQAVGECRYPGRESMVWRQLRLAVRLGILPAAVYYLVKVTVDCPSLVVRDKNAEAGTNEKYFKLRVKSRQTIQSELSLDAKQEDANFKADGIDPSKPEQAPAPPGQPGQPGQPPPVVSGNPARESVQEAQDAAGKQHKDAGPGGGQFVKQAQAGHKDAKAAHGAAKKTAAATKKDLASHEKAHKNASKVQLATGKQATKATAALDKAGLLHGKVEARVAKAQAAHAKGKQTPAKGKALAAAHAAHGLSKAKLDKLAAAHAEAHGNHEAARELLAHHDEHLGKAQQAHAASGKALLHHEQQVGAAAAALVQAKADQAAAKSAAKAGKAPKGAKAKEPDFTGKDKLGREWVNGELVAAKKPPTAPPSQAASLPGSAASGAGANPAWAKGGSKQLDPVLKAAGKGWAAQLTGAERQAVRRYVDPDSAGAETFHAGPINAALRGGQPIDAGQQAHLKILNAAIGKAGKLPQPAEVYRAIKLGSTAERDAALAKFRKLAAEGGQFAADTPVSTSLDPDTARGYLNNNGFAFAIQAKTGAYANAVFPDGYNDEAEILQQIGTKYRVVGVEDNAPFGTPVIKGGKQPTTAVVRLEEIGAAPTRESKDASGKQHKDSGPGGGQFTKGAGGGPAKAKDTAPAGDAAKPQAHSLFAAARAKLSAAGKAAYAKLPRPLQRAVDYGAAAEHKLEAAYRSGKALATAVAKERGLSDAHVERVGRILAVADAVARWTTNIPLAHTGLEGGTHGLVHALGHAAEEALAAVGGPVTAGLFLAAKVGYYVPVASLAYVAYSMGRATLAGRSPFQLISRARARIRAAKEQEHAGHH